ncbi:MAG: fibronectin type III domain-containing protein [Eubacterium sp.]
MESDDAGNPGNTTYTIQDTGDSAEAGAAALKDTNATLKNGTYNGNIWNNIYNNTEALNVTLENATLTGTISSSYGYHVGDDGERLENGTVLNACTSGDYRKGDLKDYQKIGAQYNVANKQINNPVNVSLTDASTWNVKLADGTNGEADAIYINDLRVAEGCAVTSDVPVTIYYYGTLENKGTISDNITLVKSEGEIVDKEDDGIVATVAHSFGTVIFKVVDENGKADASLATVNAKALNSVAYGGAYVGFNVSVAEGYGYKISCDGKLTNEQDVNGYQNQVYAGGTVLITVSKVKDAATAEITAQPKSATYTVGAKAAALTVSAKSPDGGKLSYQWYTNTENSVYGGKKIAGATSASYTPDTSTAGTVWYYCVVKNELADSFATVRTTPANVTVKAAAPVSPQVQAKKQTISGTSSYTKVYKKNATFKLNASAKTKLSYASGNTKVATVDSNGKVTLKGIGTAKITIKAAATDKYNAATKTVTVKVNPAQGKVTKATSTKKGQLTVKWRADSLASGYKVQASTSKTFKKGVKSVTIKKKGTTSVTLKKLTSGKKYYVRVRTYKKVGNITYTGAYSKAVLSNKIK